MIIWTCLRYSTSWSWPKKIFQTCSNPRPGLLISSPSRRRKARRVDDVAESRIEEKIHRFPLVVLRSRRRAAITRDLCPFSNRFAIFVRLPVCLADAGRDNVIFIKLKPLNDYSKKLSLFSCVLWRRIKNTYNRTSSTVSKISED